MTLPDSSPEAAATTFADLQIHPAVLRATADVGYESPTAIQAATIPPLMAGSDVVGLAQTGTGKTAAFAIPILSKIDLTSTATQALVLAPTRELALQVAEAFSRYGAHLPKINVLPIYGGSSYGVQLAGLRRGAQVVVGTPGRVIDHLERGTLDLSRVDYLVLDEADEMLAMGFAEDVERILSETPEYKQVALFSATMPPAIRKLTKKYLHDPFEVTAKSKTATAENISQRYIQVAGPRKMEALTRVLEVEQFEAMIVFVRTKQATEEVAEKLRARGFSAAAINGDIPQAQRERTITALKKGGAKGIDILVATDVAARGLDVERISHVLNYDIPHDTESYVHRIGRTGRAGRSGTALLFVSPRERHLLKAIEKATRQTLTEAELAHRRGRQRPAGGQVRRLHHRGPRRSGNRAVPQVGAGLRTRARRPDGRHRRGAGGAVPRRRGIPDGARTAARTIRTAGTSGPSRKRRGPQSRSPPTGSRWANVTRSVRVRSSAPSPTRGVCIAAISATSRSDRTSRWWSCRPNCLTRRSKSLSRPASRGC